jgi:PST family polysaccharide transporter
MNTVRNQLIKGTAYSALAKYSGVVISLIVTAILARLLSPEDFGIATVATIVISFLSLFSSFGFEPAIIQFKNLTNNDYSNIFSFTFWIGIFLTVAFYLIAKPISHFYQNDSLIIILRLLCINLLFATLNVVPNALIYKDKLFRFIAIRSFIVQVIGGIVSVFAALLGAGVYALIIAPIFSSVIIFILNIRKFPQKLALTFGIESLKKILSYSLYQFLFSILNFFSKSLDKLIIGKGIGMDLLGFYEKSYRLMMLPVQNITYVMNPVIHPVFSDLQSNLEKMAKSYEKMIRVLAFLGFSISVLLYFNAEELVLILFGHNWIRSIPSFEILSLSVGFQIILSTSGSIFQASNSTKHLFIFGLITSLISLSAVVLFLVIYNTIESVAWAVTISSVINFGIIYLVMYKRILNRGLINLLKLFPSPLFISVILISVNILSDMLFSIKSPLISLIISGSLSLIVFVLYIQFTKEYDILREIRMFVKKRGS